MYFSKFCPDQHIDKEEKCRTISAGGHMKLTEAEQHVRVETTISGAAKYLQKLGPNHLTDS